MAADAEGIARLTARIDGLDPMAVSSELSPLLSDGHPTIARQLIDEGEPEPVLTFLGSIEGAIKKVDGHDTRMRLGSQAVSTVVEAVSHSGLPHRSFDDSLSLAEQAARFADISEDPRDKAYQLRSVSEGARRIRSGHDFEVLRLSWHVSSYLARAESAAHDIEEPISKAHALAWVGESAAESIVMLELQVRQRDAASQEPLVDLLPLPTRLFDEALEAANSLKNPETRTSQKASLAGSVAKSAAKVQPANPALSEELGTMSAEHIATILTDLETDGSASKVSPSEKATILVELGTKLAKIIEEEFYIAGDSPLQQQLINEAVEVFRAAGNYAEALQTMGHRVRSKIPFGHHLSGQANYASVSAGRILKTDFKAAKDVFSVAYDLAVTQDTLGEHVPDHRDTRAVVEFIDERAEQTNEVRRAFELFSLVHNLEGRYASEGRSSGSGRTNATRCLSYLSRASAQELTGIDTQDPDFIRFIVKVAASDTSHSRWNQLFGLARHVEDEELKTLIADTADSLRQREADQRKPRSETAQMARNVLDGRQPVPTTE